MNSLIVKKLVYPELSYKIIGILFEVYNEVGPGLQEKIYQRAIALRLKQIGLRFTEQARVNLKFKNKNIGHYFLDFLIEKKVVLELKKESRLLKRDIEQVYAYLKATKLKLGIIANFTSQGVKYKRILNLY
jgi:GxxExxY protein